MRLTMPDQREKVECKFCGTLTIMTSTQMCDNCWEVEHRMKGMGLDLSLKIFTSIFGDKQNGNI